MKKIGICGLGFVGNAIYCFFQNQYIKNNNMNIVNSIRPYILLIYDKYKKINEFDILLDTDILYICLPTNYNNTIKTYDMTELDNTIQLLDKHNYKGIILIKSTVLPLYCSTMNSLYTNLKIIHNPEFLSARTAIIDFALQNHIILGFTYQSNNIITYIYEFYKVLFPTAFISIVDSHTSSIVKLACNGFYATKIQFFTEIFLLCKKLNMNYDLVRDLMLRNNWINPMHTNVPGPDNLISYGGVCLPKDICALNQLMISHNCINNVISSVIKERNIIRNVRINKRRNSI